MTAWWGSRKQVSPRLWLEVQAMRGAFGNTFQLTVPQFGKLYWEGTVEINLTTVPNPLHVLRVEYLIEFPNLPPAAYVTKPHIYSTKHQYENGQLCLYNPRDGQNYGWNPARSTALTVVGWAIEWLYSFYTYKATGKWPGIEESVANPPEWPRRRTG